MSGSGNQWCSRANESGSVCVKLARIFQWLHSGVIFSGCIFSQTVVRESCFASLPEGEVAILKEMKTDPCKSTETHHPVLLASS